MSLFNGPGKYAEAFRKGIFVSGILAAAFFFTACPTVKDVYSPKELTKLLKKAGFVPLPFPDSKCCPGSIIKVTDKDGVIWIDDLTSCNYPLREFEEPSHIPAVTFTKKCEFGATALINIKGITAGPGFERVSKIQFEITDHGADALRLIKLKVWMADPENIKRVNTACLDELAKSDVYLVTEAFRISKGKYTLFDSSGAKIKIETPLLKNLIQVQPEVKYEVTADGSLVIEQPVYFAVRKATRVGGDFEPLGRAAGEAEVADAIIERQFFKTYGKR
jgi:hypothetical protein